MRRVKKRAKGAGEEENGRRGMRRRARRRKRGRTWRSLGEGGRGRN